MVGNHQIVVAILAISGAANAAESYDYIIVGGGTSGLTVANKLTEDPAVSVAVIDPGPDRRRNTNVTDPLIWINNLGSETDWAYKSVAQADVDGRVLTYSAGKGIGGTSLINGMTYIRGDKPQFDAWEQLGNPGWNWDTLYPYYKQIEQFTPPSEAQQSAGASYNPAYHGTDGKLHVGFPFFLTNGTLESSVVAGWQNLSFPVNKDVNSGSTHGFSVWPQTLDRNTDHRWDAATAFYWPIKNRKNLKLINGTALRATWAPPSYSGSPAAVSGVEYVDQSNRSCTVAARKEVIVSAGSLRTPIFLEMSGVGNPELLQKHGIAVKVALPAVGENMQDQTNQNIAYTSTFNITGTAPYAVFSTAHDLFGANTSAVAASAKNRIPAWAKTVANASGGALHPSALETIYHIQHDLMFNKNVTIVETLPTGATTLFLAVFWGLLPFSRGSVHLSSPTTPNEPLIDPKFFLIDQDLDVNIAAGRLAQRFFETESARTFITGRASPNYTVLPDEATTLEWADYLRSTLASNYHPVGTAAMMARELGGVVDPQLRVYGTSNLRVIDASALPTQFSGHLTATLYAVAMRAAESIQASNKS